MKRETVNKKIDLLAKAAEAFLLLNKAAADLAAGGPSSVDLTDGGRVARLERQAAEVESLDPAFPECIPHPYRQLSEMRSTLGEVGKRLEECPSSERWLSFAYSLEQQTALLRDGLGIRLFSLVELAEAEAREAEAEARAADAEGNAAAADAARQKADRKRKEAEAANRKKKLLLKKLEAALEQVKREKEVLQTDTRAMAVAKCRKDGMTIAETARKLELKVRTVLRAWSAWRELTGEKPFDAGRPGLKIDNKPPEQAENEKARGGRTPRRGSKDGVRG